MSLEPRSKMISFRLSEQEYELLREVCFKNGVRSVSELGRAAINMLLQQPARAPQHSLASRVSDLEGRLHLLSMEVRKLSNGA
jgi:Arc/MetJ-type ribon-helix-helix transcriptional regulator